MTIKKIMALMAFAMFAIASFNGAAVAEENAKSDVCKIKTNAFCNGCKTKIEGKLKKTDGVMQSSLNLSNKVVSIKYNPAETNPDKLLAQVTSLGYEANVMKSGTSESEAKSSDCCKSKKKCKSKCGDKKDLTE